MANQSLISVPPDVQNPVVLQRFLSRLVEQLDVVLGNRAGPSDQYVNQDALTEQVEELQQAIVIAKESVELLLNQLDESTEVAARTVLTSIKEINDKNTSQDEAIDAIILVNDDQNSRLDNLESAGYIIDAPNDGNSYVRNSGSWVLL